ncbi:MAG: vitamin K epoxide reductase family protein [Pseudomonadota bacterium]
MPKEPMIPDDLSVPDDEKSSRAALSSAAVPASPPEPTATASVDIVPPAAAPPAPAPAVELFRPPSDDMTTAYGIPAPPAAPTAATIEHDPLPVSMYGIIPPPESLGSGDDDDDDLVAWKSRPRSGSPRLRQALWVLAAAALFGATLSAVSTADFVQHLDRQVHSIHCSIIPGAGQSFADSGCKAALMSPYSSVLRTTLWGGLPIALLALAVFAYLVYRAVDFSLRPQITRRETMFLIAATGLPVAMSAIYGTISATRVGALCSVCLGMYLSSALALAAAVFAHRQASAAPLDGQGQKPFLRWFGEGVLFVCVLGGLHLALAPTSERSLKGCGTLVKKDDPARVLLHLGGRHQGVDSVAVMDPLCAACKGFDGRLAQSGLRDRLNLRTVLMPLDSSCNWMVKQSVHPGACAVSEAMLCDAERAEEVLSYAFEQQADLIALARKDEKALRTQLENRFPHVKGCLGTPAIKNKLNKSLRWTVANALPVLTPQLFVGDTRVCDEDTDLGLEFTVAALLEQPAATRSRR